MTTENDLPPVLPGLTEALQQATEHLLRADDFHRRACENPGISESSTQDRLRDIYSGIVDLMRVRVLLLPFTAAEHPTTRKQTLDVLEALDIRARAWMELEAAVIARDQAFDRLVERAPAAKA